jgi:hypothetical protein
MESIDRHTQEHAYKRHGAQTTLAQQKRRAEIGLTPDGEQDKKLRNATRFIRHSDQEAAYRLARREFKAGRCDRPCEKSLPRIIGEGYYAGGAGYSATNTFVAVFNNKGGLVTLYPKLP